MLDGKSIFCPFVKDDFFDENEQKIIWEGLDKIHELNYFLPPIYTGTAIKDGFIAKKNSGYFLNPNQIEQKEIEKLYSTILKVFYGTTLEYSKLGMWESTILNTLRHSVLISYYDDGDEYKEHTDETIFTILMWFYKTPKNFLGGDLYLPEIQSKVEVKNNRIVIIPSKALHSVSKVKMEKYQQKERSGRYCITLFLR